MFERYLAEALATHCRHIIRDFDADKVKFSVWNGEVILRDLTLKKDAIQQLEGGSDLPFKISYGHIGTFELRIPWNLLGFSKRTRKREGDETKSCSVILSDVNIIISPSSSQKSNDGEEESEKEDPQTERIKKERMVQSLLEEALFRKNIELVAKDDANAKKSFIKNLITNVLSSLTVTIKNIHIRYEDPGDCLGFGSSHQFGSRRRIRHRPPFAVGIALEEFRLANSEQGPQEDHELYHISDREGVPVESNQSKSKAPSELFSIQHKLAAAKALSIYWDSDISSNELIQSRVQKKMQRKRHTRNRSGHSSDDDSDNEATMNKNNEVEESSDEADSEKDEFLNDDLFQTLLAKSLNAKNEKRTFILQPSSPSLQFSVVSVIDSERGSTEDVKLSVPASRAVLTLPPSQMNITKDTLEDIAYFRKSFGLWKEMRTSLLTRKIYTEITKARPLESPLDNPRGWWHYAFEAVKTLSRIEKENENKSKIKKKGWLGLLELLKARREYLSLQEALLSPNIQDEKKEDLNHQLCLLEDTLEPAEIVAFRLDALKSSVAEPREKPLKDDSHSKEASSWWNWGQPRSIETESKDNLQHILFEETEILTVQYRQTIYAEMVATIEVGVDFDFEAQKFESGIANPSKDNVSIGGRFELTVLSPQLILQIDDIILERAASNHSLHLSRRRPVVQLICASVQKLRFHRNSMLDITSTFASLEILDLLEGHSSFQECPRLVTRKRSWLTDNQNSEISDESFKSVVIGGKTYTHGGTISVTKASDLKENKNSISCQSDSVVTTINIKLSPMEIVYSPETVQTLSKVFSTTKTAELAVDYRRLKRMLSNWKAKQKQRLIEVLVRKERNVITNIDIAAPVFLMHDKTSNGTLVADLGRLTLRDVRDASKKTKGYDDTWELSLQNIQVFSMPRPGKVFVPAYNLVHHTDTCQLVEPFSLEFIISTSFIDEDTHGITSRVLIDATLPRLVFNLSSSAVRLVHRLNRYRKVRKSKKLRPGHSQVQKNNLDNSELSEQGKDGNKKSTSIDFKFSAPLIALRLINDVDGRDCTGTLNGAAETQIVKVVIRGIGGELSRVFNDGMMSTTTFNARLKAILADDLYQEAGKDFSALLSSQCPTNKSEQESVNKGPNPLYSDLVRVNYDDRYTEDTEGRQKTLSIEFHELYVEWNPETFAAIQKSLRLSNAEREFFVELQRSFDLKSPMRSMEVTPSLSMKSENSQSIDDSVAFFDAVEEEFGCTLSDEDIFLSEASSSEDGSNHYLFDLQNDVPSQLLSPIVVKAMRAISVRDLHLNNELDNLLHQTSTIQTDDGLPTKTARSMFSAKFQLSKLRVRFNKESRLRRLMVAEMNETLIQYRTKSLGGNKTVAKFGNFTLLDPCKYDGSTLYGEILGLKTGADRSESMLEITRETFPRNIDTLHDHSSDAATGNEDEKNLTIDQTKRSIRGCDAFVTMHFSPMRFVLLQQLWLEMADYFFEGIVGYEVWGRERPRKNAGSHDDRKIEGEIMSSQNQKELYGANANGVRFLRFRITMDSPVIILPVTYRSPQHLRFDLDGINIENKFKGEIESLCKEPEGSSAQYVQWYNNCNIQFQGLRLNSWCGTQLNISKDPKMKSKEENESRIPMTITVQWPIGPTAFTIVPKWNIHCRINKLRLLFRKNDFALFQHIVWYNIGEESRHLDEWNALQNLPSDQLVTYKNKIMVNFGYDKKDGPPSTFHFKLDITSVIFHFCLDENSHVADLEGSYLKWSLKKVKDRISRQLLTFNSIHLSQTSTNSDWAAYQSLLFPLKKGSGDSDEKPQLVYRSTSRPCGDNVKLLTVNNACIYLIYPAWMFVKSFFQNLPDSDVLSQEEVLGSIQIADRWYRIDTGIPKVKRKSQKRTAQRPVINRGMADFQLRIVLKDPRIVLVHDSSSRSQKGRAVTLGLRHLDFFHRNDPKTETIQKTLFLHDLEVFTGSDDMSKDFGEKRHQRSLLYPLCAGVGIVSGYSTGNLVQSKKWLSSDVVSFRAAYTDMTLAIDVFRKVLSDYHHVQNQSSLGEPQVKNMDLESSKQIARVKESVGVACGGFDLLVIDDSGRHFAGAQELVQLSLSGILYKISKAPTPQNDFLSLMRLQLHDVELTDCLQPLHSPFRVVAVGHNLDAGNNDTNSLQGQNKKRCLDMNKKVFDDFMTWETHSMVDSKDWGYTVSDQMKERSINAFTSEMRQPFNDSNLIDIYHKIPSPNMQEYRCAIGKIALQWNPSMAIALQRFLGRIRKDVKEKQSSSFPHTKITPSFERKDDIHHLDAEIEIESVTVCLNKEHQQRRLLQVTISDALVAFQRDEYARLSVQGSLGDLNAWDSDRNRDGQIEICQENRLVVGVLHNPAELDDPHVEYDGTKSTSGSQNLLTFNFYSTPSNPTRSDEIQSKFKELRLPDWVLEQVGRRATTETVDDCLSLSIATIRFNHIKERTGEIIDYLSNGLPGKGMGATSRAAKGFIEKRIKTRSFTNLNVNSPQLFLPCNRGNQEGVIVCLGDVRLKSWFDEATLDDSKAIDCNDLMHTRVPVHSHVPMTPRPKSENSANKKYWWRILSLSILGLGWRVNRKDDDHIPTFLQIENPLNFHLQVRKPPSQSHLPMIVRCKMTAIETVLTYNEYVVLNIVLRENIGKKVDKSLWDNLEETSVYDEDPNGGVKYSKNARFVRYGKLSGRHSKKEGSSMGDTTSSTGTDNLKPSVDIRFSLDGIVLILHRDDKIPLVKEDTAYDIVKLEVDGIDMHMISNADGSKIGTVRLQSFTLLDVGDVGRIARERLQFEASTHSTGGSLTRSKIRRPSLFSVIAEGYDTDDEIASMALKQDKEPQLIVTFDTGSSAIVDLDTMKNNGKNSRVTSIRITLNHLNINPLVRPLSEVGDFIARAWPMDKDENSQEVPHSFEVKEVSGIADKIQPEETHQTQQYGNGKTRAIHLTVITNYPRVFLVPDETDTSTKALVLRGLTVLNATMVDEIAPSTGSKATTVSIQGQFHSLESFINSDPRSALERCSTRGLSRRVLNEVKEEKNISETNDFLGVALIEPVTASFTFHQMKRSYFPSIREVFVSMEPVSTTFSFEDIKLIEVVLSRWRNERSLARLKLSPSIDLVQNQVSNEQQTPSSTNSVADGNYDSDSYEITVYSQKTDNQTSQIRAIPFSDSLDAKNNIPFCGECIPSNSIFTDTPAPPELENSVSSQDWTYDINFSGQKLGLELRQRESSITVAEVLDTAIKDKVRKGDVIVCIEAHPVAGLPFQAVVNLINKTKRPIKITFGRFESVHESDVTNKLEDELSFMNDHHIEDSEPESEDSPPKTQEQPQTADALCQTLRRSYDVSLFGGVDNGIEIEKCICGDAAIVSKIASSTFYKSCPQGALADYLPKPGVIIIAVNGENVLNKGFKGASELIESCKKERSNTEEIYTLTFLEAMSDDWGSIDKVDIVIAGIKLTLIDDINGRDMPLLQGTLRSVALKMERGLGLDCNFIKVGPPSLLVLQDIREDGLDSPGFKSIPVISDLSEVITKVVANVEIQLDYYNARIAVWEPLVESSCLSTAFESQKGSLERARPGALSMDISDYESLQSADNEKQPYICINISDAAADLLFTALYEWRAWRKSYNRNTQFDVLQNNASVERLASTQTSSSTVSISEGFEDSMSTRIDWQLNMNSSKKIGAAQNAAQAALIFAKRRGVESQKSEDSKPFILRNQTGVTISFLPEVQADKDIEQGKVYAGKTSYKFQNDKKLAITTIQNGKEASFNLETTENYNVSDSSNRNGNKVRSYDGQFPLLSVNFHTGAEDVHVELLQHMSVVRIGETMKSLVVKSARDSEKIKSASILVVWSVTLENNRRIITLSSAVRVSSRRCGIPIEVGVRQLNEENDDDQETYDVIKSIGFSTSTTVCYLPLWLQLSFKASEVFIRPLSKSNSFKWCSTSILRLEKLTSNSSLSSQESTSLWAWTPSDHTTSIICESRSCSRPPAHLSYECNYETPSLATKISDDFFLSDFPDCEYQIKCVDICSTLTIRNALPNTLQWSIVEANTSSISPVPMGASFVHTKNTQLYSTNEGIEVGIKSVDPNPIISGHTNDIFAYNFATMNIGIKVRCDSDSEWSECVPINYIVNKDGIERLPLSEDEAKLENTNEHYGQSLFRERTFNAQSYNKFRPALTFGIKMNPRIAHVFDNSRSLKFEHVIGFDLIVYSEIWIKNLTLLPIIFGVPSTQIDHASSQSASLHSMHEPLRKRAAEAALSELSNILEFGETWNDVGDRDELKEVLPLSKQESVPTVEEVFEYKELDNERVIRHWWAGEYHGHIKPDVISFGSLDGTEWVWIDESWNLDTSGGCKASQGCWESCAFLTNDRDGSFSPLRHFNQNHRYRRRRWFRRKKKRQRDESNNSDDLISSFHQPALNTPGRLRQKDASADDKTMNPVNGNESDNPLKFHFRVEDGSWSAPAVIPGTGAAHGVLRIPASRWPALMRSEEKSANPVITGNSMAVGFPGLSTICFQNGSLSTQCFDVCYRVAPIEGQWGDHSRLLVLYPRFYIRNDSEKWHMDVKQSGTSDKSAIRLKPLSSKAFYWTNVSLPHLICVRPAFKKGSKPSQKMHSWSGGFDITSLGMIPLMLQQDQIGTSHDGNKSPRVEVLRALIELRSGTGGTGISVSIKEDLSSGEDSLYRIENRSPFPLWIVQDGVLANPGTDSSHGTVSFVKIIEPEAKVPYGLVKPFRQGKYAGRKAVSLEELLRLRVGLAPLATRDGIESTKVISLSIVGATMRLKPAKLRTFFDEVTIADLMNVNVQGVVSSDGATRVLKFTLVERNLTASSVIKNSVRMHTDGLSNDQTKHQKDLINKLTRAAETAKSLLHSKTLQKYDPTENQFKKDISLTRKKSDNAVMKENDCNYSFRASFRGLVFSLVDRFPSEVGVVTIRNIRAMSEWNARRSKESTAALDIGWIQIDNHCPNAPFPVVLSPTPPRIENVVVDADDIERPFLSLVVVVAPRHKSDILCLEGVTIALRDISLCTDLAFVLRVQHQVLGILGHLESNKVKHDINLDSSFESRPKHIWQVPDFSVIFALRDSSPQMGHKKMYFEGLTILPFTVRLSVAPSVALTSAQATLEGVEAGAIHAAVRKGDLLIGDNTDGVVGVKIGSKNRTAVAVIQGIFKSILVDSLLRCDDVSMTFSGLAVRNHLSTMHQLKTFIGQHYLSLLKSNVPALIGSLAAFGNPVGLIRGFGDGVTDFVSEPIKGFRRSVEELDPTYVMDGVARGTGSLARHTVGGIVDSASLLTETFSKNMAVLTLDRKYAQRRDRFKVMPGTNTTFVGGVESGVGKLLRGVAEGVVGVVRAPMRGAEKRGVEGFAKGVGKGLLGLVVKPVIGISDAATDLMVGVKGSLEGVANKNQRGSANQSQLRPRRAFYGRDRRLRPYVFVDAISAAIMLRTRLGSDNYLSHVDMGGRVAILSVKKFLLLGDDGEQRMLIRLKNIKRIDLRKVPKPADGFEWGVLIFLKAVRNNGNEVEVVTTPDKGIAKDICAKIQQGITQLE